MLAIDYLVKKLGVDVITVLVLTDSKLKVLINKPVNTILSLNAKFKSINKHSTKYHTVAFKGNSSLIVIKYRVGSLDKTGSLTLTRNK